MNDADIDYSVALSWTFDSTPRQPRTPPRANPPAGQPAGQAASAHQESVRDIVNPSPADLRWHRIVAGILDVIARFPDAHEAVRAYYGGPLPEPAG